jgi:hypothetical protein
MAADDAAERDALANELREGGWVYVSWDALNRAWQFQGSDGSRRLITAETLVVAMRILRKQLADRDARDA